MVNVEHRRFELEKHEAQKSKSHSDRGLRRRELTRGLEHQEKPFWEESFNSIVLESLLGRGRTLVDQAVLKHLYSKIGLRYDS